MRSNNRLGTNTLDTIDSYMERERDRQVAEFRKEHGADVKAEFQRLMGEFDCQALANEAASLVREMDRKLEGLGIRADLTSMARDRVMAEITRHCEREAFLSVSTRVEAQEAA